MKLAPFLLAGLLIIACGCGKREEERSSSAKEPSYGEPVGIQMEASQGIPAFEIALAVSKGAAVEPLVAPLSGLVHKALRGCPDFVKSAMIGEPTQIALVIEQGKTTDASVAGPNPDPCLTDNLTAQTVAGIPAARMDVVALLRFAGPAAKDAGATKP